MRLQKLLLTKTAIFALSVIYSLFLLGIVINTIYAVDENKNLTYANLFFDDGGIYTSEAIALDHWSTLQEQNWFRQIKSHISFDDLREHWGGHAPRVKFIFSRMVRDGWLAIIVGLSQFTDSYQNAFRASLLIFPFLVLLKYLLLIFLFYRKNLLPVLISLVFIDVIQPYDHDYYWFTTSAYGSLFFSTGMIINAFGGHLRAKGFLSYSLMIFGGLCSKILVVPLVVIAVSEFLMKYGKSYVEQAFQILSKYRLSLFHVGITLLLSTFLISLLYLGGGLIDILMSKNYRELNHLLELLSQRWEYIAFVLIILLYGVDFLIKSQTDRVALEIRTKITMIILAAWALVLVSGVLDSEIKQNVGRLQKSIYLFLVVYGGVALLKYHSHMIQKKVLVIAAILGFAIMADRYNPTMFKAKYRVEFQSSDFAALMTSSEGEKYFLAATPQQVYNYFLAQDFLRHPLVLDIHTDHYDPSSVEVR